MTKVLGDFRRSRVGASCGRSLSAGITVAEAGLLRGSFCAASSISLWVSRHSGNLSAKGDARAISIACLDSSVLPSSMSNAARLLR